MTPVLQSPASPAGTRVARREPSNIVPAGAPSASSVAGDPQTATPALAVTTSDSVSPHVAGASTTVSAPRGDLNAVPIEATSDRGCTLRYDLRASAVDSLMFNVMVGMGETYFPAFVLALGMGELASGLVASVPLMLGACLQMISPFGLKHVRSNRLWVFGCISLQALSFVPLVVGAYTRHLPLPVAFAIIACYWAGGFAAGPAWNTWMESVVPGPVRAKYFAWRSRIGQVGLLVGFLAGGLTLQYGKNTGDVLWAFAAIFLVAGLCRSISAAFIYSQHEPPLVGPTTVSVSWWELICRAWRGEHERMLVFFLAVQVAVQISGPYFTPYMLKQIQMSYSSFTILLATSFLAKILTLPAWGRFAYRYGVPALLRVGGIGIVPVAGAWLYATEYWQIILLQFVAGVVWAAYELAVFLTFFESVSREERTSIMTKFNFANSVALVLGAAIGGVVLRTLGECPETYLALFGLSSIARGFALLLNTRTTARTAVTPRAPLQAAA